LTGDAPFLELFVVVDEAVSDSLSFDCKTSCFDIIAYLWDAVLAVKSPLNFANYFSSPESSDYISVFY
jgi:hypothetical protein